MIVLDMDSLIVLDMVGDTVTVLDMESGKLITGECPSYLSVMTCC